MKRSVLSIFGLSLTLIGIAIISASSSNGRAFAARQGNTGAPGEPTTCRSCHGVGFGTTVSLAVKDSQGNVVTSYVPGNVYTIDFSVNTTSGNPSRYGYQMVSLLSGNASYNAWSNPSGNTRIASASNGRSYAEHRGKSVSPNFSVDWTAPVAGSGTVRLYGGGAAVNNNGGTSGDGGNTISVTLTESLSTSIAKNDIQGLKVYPNPVRNQLNVELNESASIELYNVNGQLAKEYKISTGLKSIDVSDLERGVYLLRIWSENAFSSSIIVLQ